MFPRRGAIAIALTTVALVLLLSFKTPDQFTTGVNGSTSFADTAPAPSPSNGAPVTTSDGTTPTTDGATPAPTAAPTTQDATTVTGPEVDNQFGPVQVEVTISGGSITDVVAVQLPSGGRSGRISSAAESILREEALQAQSAQIDTVSGATYTSLAYAQSLQAALDQAGFR